MATRFNPSTQSGNPEVGLQMFSGPVDGPCGLRVSHRRRALARHNAPLHGISFFSSPPAVRLMSQPGSSQPAQRQPLHTRHPPSRVHHQRYPGSAYTSDTSLDLSCLAASFQSSSLSLFNSDSRRRRLYARFCRSDPYLITASKQCPDVGGASMTNANTTPAKSCHCEALRFEPASGIERR